MATNTEIVEFMNNNIDAIELKGADAGETANFRECIRSTLEASGITENLNNIIATTTKDDVPSTVSGLVDNIGDHLRQIITDDAATMLCVVIAGVLSVVLTKFCTTEVKKESC